MVYSTYKGGDDWGMVYEIVLTTGFKPLMVLLGITGVLTINRDWTNPNDGNHTIGIEPWTLGIEPSIEIIYDYSG